MVQQMVDSKFNEYGLGTTDNELSTRDKHIPVAIKKTPLRDLQNENKISVRNPSGNSPFSKDRDPVTDAIKVSGTKRPSTECSVSPPHHQSPNSTTANGRLVYVRRKPEAESGKSSTCNGTGINADCTLLRHPGNQDEKTHPNSQLKEQKVSCFPAFAPFPISTSVGSSGKPSVPVSLGMSGMRLAPAESNLPQASTIPPAGNTERKKNVNWEERFKQLQMLLQKLDQSDQEDYLQMLRSLSSVELSRHAVELEKRSIQLSLEEAKEMHTVAVLNVLGKSTKNFKEPGANQNQMEK